MGDCCCKARPDSKPDDAGHKELITRDPSTGEDYLGPCKTRGTTDIVCCLLYLGFWGVFCFVTFLGFQNGDPHKLYRPRDYRGDYCNTAENWEDGLNLEGFKKLTYTMNVTKSIDHIAKQLVCSSVAEKALKNSGMLDAEALDTYECACCKTPCGSCYGSLVVDDLTTPGAASSIVSGKMSQLTGKSSAVGLFSAGGLNGEVFTQMWEDATSYFIGVCLKDCNAPGVANVSTLDRSYTYAPPPDANWSYAWKVLSTHSSIPSGIKDTINSSFIFKALPRSQCPYHERYCVPFPGVDFEELEFDYCTFKMNAEVVAAIGGSIAKVYEETGANKIVEGLSDSVGSGVGDLMNTLDILLIVSVCSAVIGMIFLVVLRFCIKCCVWFSIFMVLFIFLAGGAMLYVRSFQCNGAGLFESGKQTGVAVLATGTTAVANAVTGTQAVSEDLSGQGFDYRGVQTLTRSGKTCQDWNSQTPHQHNSTPAEKPNAGLTANYCRNPQDAITIWCYTTDPKARWELCSPIGVIQPGCPRGYVVVSETWRKILEVIAYIVWFCAFLWVVAVCCFCNQIRLAIGLNEVAASFVTQAKQVLIVPLLQILVGVAWCFAWAASVSFMLSQVPADSVPSSYYASYAEAYGTDTEPGKCTANAIPGFVWKSEGDPLSANDPCSGNRGDTTGMTPQCWRCGPPRFNFDWRFWVSLFSFLWNNAFLVALGQCIIAGAVCVWFFAPHAKKTKVKCVRQSNWNCWRYHLGSLAFGAFILAVVQFIRYVMRYLEAQAKAQKNAVMAMVMRVLQCCLWCFEKCIKFLNKNAYIQIALKGENFCRSAFNAFDLWRRNIIRFGMLFALGSIIHYIGFMFIIAATGVSGYFILRAAYPTVSPIIPMIIYVGVGYLVAMLYMNVFGLAVDSLLHCFLCAEEMKDGDPDAYIPPKLRPFLKEVEDEQKQFKLPKLPGTG